MRQLVWSALLVLLAGDASSVPPEAPRLRAEFEQHPALLIGCANLLFHHQKTLLQLTAAIHDDTPIFGILSNTAQADSLENLLERAGLDSDRIQPILEPTEGMWVRDYGPVFVSHGGHVSIVDPQYRIEPDDGIPDELGEAWDLRVAQTRLWAEGGHLAYDGRGLLLVSTMLARLNAAYDGVDGTEIQRRLQASLPFSEAHWVEPMPGEPTGHLDMFLAFIAPDRLVMASMDPDEAPELARCLDATAARLATIRSTGEPLEILRVPTPAPEGDVWFSYTNVILIGDQVLVPQYDDAGPDANRRALEFWRSAMPAREVTGIDATSIIRRHGALHCISMPLPMVPRT